MHLSRKRDERINSLVTLGTVNLRWTDDRVIQSTAADRFFGQPLGLPVGTAIGVRTNCAHIYKMLGRAADRNQLFGQFRIDAEYSDGSSECVTAAICRTIGALCNVVGLRMVSSSGQSNGKPTSPRESIAAKGDQAKSFMPCEEPIVSWQITPGILTRKCRTFYLNTTGGFSNWKRRCFR